MDLHLSGHTVIVTGGASGIGLATGRAFAAEQANVAVWDIAPSVADVAQQIAETCGIRSLGCRVDVTDVASVTEAVQQTIAEFGSIDHLVHGAAVGSGKFGFPFTNLSPSDWPRVLNVNIMGMTNVAHAIAPHLIAQRSGTMLFVASVAGQVGSQTDPPYSASKAANINFAQCLAKDLAPHGIRVNTVCPGMVQTPLNKAVWQAWHDQQLLDQRQSYDDWAAAKIRSVVPLGQWQRPEDIADMIVFLSSERAAHVTGQTINVDGGFVMHW
jgi:2-hydroxycyclohexanecarboxyl-CoA dehydrogenase